MAKFWCKNCYKVFEINILEPMDVFSNHPCIYCTSKWTEYMKYNSPLVSEKIKSDNTQSSGPARRAAD